MVRKNSSKNSLSPREQELRKYAKDFIDDLAKDISKSGSGKLTKHLNALCDITGFDPGSKGKIKYSSNNMVLIKHHFDTLGITPSIVMGKHIWKKLGYKVKEEFTEKGAPIWVCKDYIKKNLPQTKQWISKNPLFCFQNSNGYSTTEMAEAFDIKSKRKNTVIYCLESGNYALSDSLWTKIKNRMDGGRSQLLNELSDFLISEFGHNDLQAVIKQWKGEQPFGTKGKFYTMDGRIFDASMVEPIEPGKETPLNWVKKVPENNGQLFGFLTETCTKEGNFKVDISEDMSPADMFEVNGKNISINTSLDPTNRIFALLEGTLRSFFTEKEGNKVLKPKILCHAEAASYIACRYMGLKNPYPAQFLSAFGETGKSLKKDLSMIGWGASYAINMVEPALFKLSMDQMVDSMAVTESSSQNNDSINSSKPDKRYLDVDDDIGLSI